jgi:adenosylhomocysteine nucleosidase
MKPTPLLLVALLGSAPVVADPAASPGPRTVVLVSADLEWKVVRALIKDATPSPTPFGEWFAYEVGPRRERVIFFHGGWGKIAAAGSTQYAIDRWKPRILVNLGTCGGFKGAIQKGDVLVVDRTVVYDIVEMMGDAAESIAYYTTTLALPAGDLPAGVKRGPIVSGDRDLQPADNETLARKYGAVAGDWESGAIAWVARRNAVPVLILRGVSDVVGPEGSETYGNLPAFEEGARLVMKKLIDDLPSWLVRFEKSLPPARPDATDKATRE